MTIFVAEIRLKAAWFLTAALCLFAIALPPAPAQAAEPSQPGLQEALEALKPGGRVVLMRHAQTVPGTGDPDNFDVNDCETQRNLDERGITQSQVLGEAFAAAGIEIGAALSSAWCRCVDTVTFMLDAAGQPDAPFKVYEPLNSFWQSEEDPRDTSAIRELIATWEGPGTLFLSTHWVNVNAIVDESLPQGGFLVLEPTGEGFERLARGVPSWED